MAAHGHGHGRAHKPGTLIIIGGHEDKQDRCVILREVASHACDGKGKLVIVTAATRYPDDVAGEYTRVFEQLGVKDIAHLDVRTRAQAYHEDHVRALADAAVVFFTGGDQLRITSQIGDSPVYRCLMELREKGSVIAGTSAGAAVMSETMIVAGANDETNKVSALSLAPGLGLVGGVVIDSHFAERGRMGRLLGLVAENPANLGIGIDEDTAIVVDGDHAFRVIGSGAVYVVDGSTISFSSLSEKHPEGVISIYNVTLHVLGTGDRYDLNTRQPTIPEGAENDGDE